MSEQRGVWCVGEVRHGKLVHTLFELISAGRKVAAARGEPVVAVLVGGPGTQSLATQVAERGADKVIVIEHPSLAQFIDEAYARALKEAAEREKPRTLLLPASVWGRSLAPRLAVSLKTGLISDAVDLGLDAEGRLLVTRTCYAGNVVAQARARALPELSTVRPMAFARMPAGEKRAEIVPVPVDPSGWQVKTQFSSFAAEESGEIDLSSAEKIVSGGRGLGTPEGFKLIRDLAKVLGAAVGASRATVDAGWIPYRHQVGLTGRSVRPRLYMACGISGQIQHLAGMSSSDVIVAVNTDPECPMMKLATYAVVGDLYKVIPALVSEIQKVRGEVAAVAK